MIHQDEEIWTPQTQHDFHHDVVVSTEDDKTSRPKTAVIPVRGRPRLDITEEERIKARREQVRRHMQTYRQRLREDQVKRRPKTKKDVTFIIVEEPGRTSSERRGQAAKAKSVRKHDEIENASNQKQTTTTLPFSNKNSARLLVQPLTMMIDQGQVMREGFFGALLTRYLPDLTVDWKLKYPHQTQYDGNYRPIPCAKWLTSVVDAPSMLETAQCFRESVLSMGLIIFSGELSDRRQDLAAEGLRAYQRALRVIRKSIALGQPADHGRKMDLKDASGSASTAYLLLACQACSLTEVMIDRRISSNLMKHLEGMATIILQLGPDYVQQPGIARTTFYEHRTTHICYSLYHRKASFYSRPAWNDFSWKGDEKEANTHLQTLLDVAYNIPPILEEFDQIKAQIAKSAASSSHLRSLKHMQRLLERAQAVDVSMLGWWKTQVEDLSSSEAPLMRVGELPPAATMNDDTTTGGGSVFPPPLPSFPERPRIRFANFGMGLSICFFWTCRIYLLHLILEALEQMLQLLDQFGEPSPEDHNIASSVSSPAAGVPEPHEQQPQQQSMLHELIEQADQQSFDMARQICQSLEYMLEPGRGLVGHAAAMWPLDVAWTEFARQHLRRQHGQAGIIDGRGAGSSGARYSYDIHDLEALKIRGFTSSSSSKSSAELASATDEYLHFCMKMAQWLGGSGDAGHAE